MFPVSGIFDLRMIDRVYGIGSCITFCWLWFKEKTNPILDSNIKFFS